MRWMSPELIAPEKFGFKTSHPTKSSDCYALGMVIYETISGNSPFHKTPDIAVFLKVIEGERPHREEGFVESLWEMVEQCWAPQPSGRPSVESVLERLEMCSKSSAPSSLGMEKGADWNLWSDGLYPLLMSSEIVAHLNITHHQERASMRGPTRLCVTIAN